MVARFEVYLLNIDEEVGPEAKNTRPCVVISPDEMNAGLESVVVAPISAHGRHYPTRIPVEVLNSTRSIVLDQIRTVEKRRLVKSIGELGKKEQKSVLDTLQEMFAE